MTYLRPVPIALAGAILVLGIIVIAIVLSDDERTVGADLPREIRADPAVASFLASDFFPDDVKQRYTAALKNGGLHPQRLHEATESWRAISEHRCTGKVVSISETELRLERMADASEWDIAIGPSTRFSRGAAGIQPGDVVEALSSDGITADAIISYAKPVGG